MNALSARCDGEPLIASVVFDLGSLTDEPFNEAVDSTRVANLKDAGRTDEAVGVMAQFRAALGTRAILVNHDLNAPLPRTPDLATLYDHLRGAGPPLSFQDVSSVASTTGTAQLAVSLGAQTLELWASAPVPFVELATTDAGLVKSWGALWADAGP